MGRDGDTCLIGIENAVERCRLGSRQNRKKSISKKNRAVAELDDEDEQDAARGTELKFRSELEPLSLTTSNRRTFCEETRGSSNYFRVAAGNSRKRQNSQE